MGLNMVVQMNCTLEIEYLIDHYRGGMMKIEGDLSNS